MQNIKAIIFDIDDTLVQTIQCKWLALKATAKKYYNLKITDTQLKKFWGTPFQAMLTGVFSNVDDFEIIKKRYIEISRNFPMRPHRGAVAAIKSLKKHYLIAALTSSSRSVILKDLEDSKYNLKDFYFIQTSEDTPYHKPDSEVFIPTLVKLKKLKINPENIIYVGDAIRDYEAAKKARFNFIGVLSGLTSKKEFETAGLNSKNIISNLSKLNMVI